MPGPLLRALELKHDLLLSEALNWIRGFYDRCIICLHGGVYWPRGRWFDSLTCVRFLFEFSSNWSYIPTKAFSGAWWSSKRKTHRNRISSFCFNFAVILTFAKIRSFEMIKLVHFCRFIRLSMLLNHIIQSTHKIPNYFYSYIFLICVPHVTVHV